MLLTVVNIVVIVVIGVAMLRAQEYGPQSSTFWKQDIGLARTLRNSNTFKELGRKLKTSFKDPGAASSHLPVPLPCSFADGLERSAGREALVYLLCCAWQRMR